MSVFSNIQPTIWVHPNWAKALLRMGALRLDTRTGQLFTTSGLWVGVDNTLPMRGEFTRQVGYSVRRESAYGGA